MPNCFVIYPPGAGGNHVKNLMCLSGAFINSDELDPAVYDARDRAPGEVWCVGGRNLQPVFFQRILDNPGSSSVLTAHFGELVANEAQFQQVPDPRLIIITIDDGDARRALDRRQHRLGQHIHPYWLDEELLWLYNTDMFVRYFGVRAEHCLEIPLQHVWCHRLQDLVLVPLQQWLGINIPSATAELLHSKWMASNFA